jgi:thioredoxin 1
MAVIQTLQFSWLDGDQLDGDRIDARGFGAIMFASRPPVDSQPQGVPEMADVKEISDQDFEAEVLQATGPVLVDFWAPWCGPCRMIAPLVEELAKENGASLKVTKVNIDDSPQIASTYGVSAIPTLMVFKNGEVADRFVGVQPKKRLQDAIEQAQA